jgi:AcrR family transcriptional regulator
VEQQVGGKEVEGNPLERIRRIRLRLVRHLADVSKDPAQTEETRHALDRLLLAENINAHSLEYLVNRPSFERLVETVQRIEETVEDRELPIVPTGATLTIGPAIDVAPLLAQKTPRNAPDPLMQRVAAAVQGLLDQMLAQGPPPDWNCPPPIETPPQTKPSSALEKETAPPLPAGSRD